MADISVSDFNNAAFLQGVDNANKNVSGKTEGGKSWLGALVEGQMKALDAKAGEMKSLSEQVSSSNPSTMAKFQVASQEFSLLMNTVTTVIKTIGEAQTTAARKQ